MNSVDDGPIRDIMAANLTLQLNAISKNRFYYFYCSYTYTIKLFYHLKVIR